MLKLSKSVKALYASAVTNTQRGRGFLYKVRPGAETSVVFGTLQGEEVTARFTDRMIQVGGIRVENCQFDGSMAGVVVRADGGTGIGAPIPDIVQQWLAAR